MLITATTSSQKLQDMLTEADLALVKQHVGAGSPDGRYLVFLQVLGGNDVYLEFYKDATTSAGAKVANTSGEISFALTDLQDARLIGDGGTSAIRVLITK